MFVSETHLRTLAKTVGYRVCSILLTMAVTAILGGTGGQVAAMGGFALVLGSLTYYLHDRAWLFTGWNRDDKGVDSNKRILLKTIAYRIVVLIMTFIIAKFVLDGSTQTAATFALVMLVANAVLYFVWEKFCNYVDWGKFVKEQSETVVETQ
jgi:uncharacterized membrane protein